jgi:hypothetical protein
MNWLERWRQRQDLLSHGVDADLIRDNQKRYRLAFGLLGFGFLLGVLLSKVRLAETVRLIVSVIAGACFLVGFVLAAWAKQEATFLNKPDPEEPPKIFK